MPVYSDLDDIEKIRFENSVKLILKLISKRKRKEAINIFLGDLISDIIPKERDDSGEDGAIIEENDHYIVEYEKYDESDQIKSLHQSIHELIHILGIPNKKLSRGKDANGGLEIAELNERTGKWEYYGRTINESCDEIITKIALSMVKGGNIDYRADDVIMSNNLKFRGYISTIPITRLLAFAMNNEFNLEYYDLIDQEKGLLDARTSFNSKVGNIELPVNDLFYGMVVDPLYTEKRFDKYTKEGEYKRINQMLDEAVRNKNINVALLKDLMTSISSMFYNKMFQYKTAGIISEEKYNLCCDQYEKLFDRICEYYKNWYNVNIVFHESDYRKMREPIEKFKQSFFSSLLKSLNINPIKKREAQKQILNDLLEISSILI